MSNKETRKSRKLVIDEDSIPGIESITFFTANAGSSKYLNVTAATTIGKISFLISGTENIDRLKKFLDES